MRPGKVSRRCVCIRYLYFCTSEPANSQLGPSPSQRATTAPPGANGRQHPMRRVRGKSQPALNLPLLMIFRPTTFQQRNQWGRHKTRGTLKRLLHKARHVWRVVLVPPDQPPRRAWHRPGRRSSCHCHCCCCCCRRRRRALGILINDGVGVVIDNSATLAVAENPAPKRARRVVHKMATSQKGGGGGRMENKTNHVTCTKTTNTGTTSTQTRKKGRRTGQGCQ